MSRSRRQRAAESGQFGQRFADAAAQLGGLSAAVRMAGSYAMAVLADETNDPKRRQQRIDVLCAYLRLPYHSGAGSDLLEQVVATDTTVTVGGRTHDEQRTYRLQPQEREVRLTIVSIIRDHLQEGSTTDWQGYQLNFTGAVFDGGSFSGAQFSGGSVSFRGAHFSGDAVDFTGATFSGGWVNFTGAQFADGAVDFTGTTFSGGTVSLCSVFSGSMVDFHGVKFSGGAVDFSLAALAGCRVVFSGAQYSGGTVIFEGAAFSGGMVVFEGAAFSGCNVDFSHARFSGGALDLRRINNWSLPPAGLPTAERGLGLPVVWTSDWSELPDLPTPE